MQLIEMTGFNITTLTVSLFLFQIGDGLIVFKNLLVYCVGYLLCIFLKLVYAAERPYWDQSEIVTTATTCDFDFAMPSTIIFNVVFYWHYNIFMYFTKYTSTVNMKLVWSLLIILWVYIIVMFCTLFLFGNLYIL